MSGDWQDIATAPRDGTWVLLAGGSINYGWCRDDRPPAVTSQYMDGCWQFAWYDSGYYGEYETPTHWMPLPSPPREGER